MVVASSASLILLKKQWANLVAWSCASAVSLLLWIDVLYYRTFGDFLTVDLLHGIHQLPSVSEAFDYLWKPIDSLFFLDLLLVFPSLFFRPKLIPIPWKRRLIVTSLPGLLFLGTNLLWYVLADPLSTNFMRNRLYNWSHVRQHGLLAYHVYDIYHWVRPRLHPPAAVSDQVIMKRLNLSRGTIGPGFDYYGEAQGQNVLMIQLESFQSFLVDLRIEGQEVTPFLNELKRKSLYAPALDQTSHGSSSDAEYILLNSLQPPSRGPLCFLFPSNDYQALPTLLAAEGYQTIKMMPYDGAFWNARVLSESFGFKESHFTEFFRAPRRGERVGWGLSDAALYEQMVPYLARQEKPFFCYVTTLMMHYPFQELRPHQEILELPSELQNTMMGRYLQLARYRDLSLELLVLRLKEKGLWENTVLVLSGDHRSRMEETEVSRLSVPDPRPLRHRVPLLIHVPGENVKGILPASVGQMDVAPTVWHLLGGEPSRPVFLGRNTLAGKHASVSCWGFVTDEKVALWGGSDPRDSKLYQLPDNLLLEHSPEADRLYRQLDEELKVSDTLIFENRISEFVGPFSESLSGTL